MRFRNDPAIHVAALVVILSLVKIWVAAQVELTGYEATYWYYAQHPALGYFDHPAMIMWMVGASTALFGDGLVGLRVLTIAAGGLTTGFAFLAGRRLYGAEAGRLAAFAIALAPMIFAIGSRVTPDSPMFLFWMMTIWSLAHALGGGRPGWWLAAGAFLGLAMESKYPAIFLPIGVLLFLALSPDHRHWLKRPQPYFATLVALAVFSPTVIWNAQHQWESFLFQATGRIPSIDGPSPGRIHGYPLSHLLLFTPVLCAWAWWTGIRTARRWSAASWQDRLMASLGLPTLAFFALVLLARPVKHHWPTPAYLSLFLLSAAWATKSGPWVRRLHWGSIGVLGGACLALPFVLRALPDEYLSCSRHLGQEIRKLSPRFVIGNGTWTATRLAYELRPLPAVDFAAVGRTDTRLARWWHPEDVAGQDAVVVYEAHQYPEEMERVRAWADQVEEPVEVLIPRNGNRKTSWILLKARGYRPAPR